MTDPLLLTPREAADRMRVSVRTVYNLVELDELRHTRLPGKSRTIIRVYASAVDEIIEQGTSHSVDA